MGHQNKSSSLCRSLFYAFIGFAVIASGVFITDTNRFIIGFVQILYAIAGYFLIVYRVADRNWMDIRALFSAIWTGTIGLAALRLTAYQEPWMPMTWILLAAANGLFLIGATLGLMYSNRHFEKICEKTKQISPFRLSLHPERLFWICIGVSLIGLICFICNIWIRGYVPAFASISDGYLQFYTKFYLFCIAATMISGLCYYCIATQKLSMLKKILLGICILYNTILFPLLVVSRGAFMTSALSLATMVFYVHRKKLWVLILCVVLIVGTYLGASELRGYTADQLNVFFEPSTITLDAKDPLDMEEDPSETTPEEADPSDSDDDSQEDDGHSFTLSPKAAFVYTYLSVGHDNFNEAVQNSVQCTYGLRQLEPFNVILRIPQINQALEDCEFFKVRNHLNTINLVGYCYYDFHAIGILLILLWAFIFGIMQGFAEKARGPFALLTLGNTMTPVILCSFTPWLSLFQHWMHWGVVFILCIIACIGCKKTKKHNTK